MLHEQPESQSRDIAAYLATLGASPDEPDGPAPPEALASGGRLFADLGCVGCHILPGNDNWASDPKRVPLRFVGEKWKPKALVAFLACLMVAAAATSVATNLARVSR